MCIRDRTKEEDYTDYGEKIGPVRSRHIWPEHLTGLDPDTEYKFSCIGSHDKEMTKYGWAFPKYFRTLPPAYIDACRATDYDGHDLPIYPLFWIGCSFYPCRTYRTDRVALYFLPHPTRPGIGDVEIGIMAGPGYGTFPTEILASGTATPVFGPPDEHVPTWVTLDSEVELLQGVEYHVFVRPTIPRESDYERIYYKWAYRGCCHTEETWRWTVEWRRGRWVPAGMAHFNKDFMFEVPEKT